MIPVACSNGDFSFNDNQVPYKANPKTFALIKEGDILLRQGLGPFSTFIVRGLDEKHSFSHCGIVCNINNQLIVVHSISPELSGIDGIQTQTIREFFADVADSNVAIIRPNMDSVQRVKFTSTALTFLKRKIPFDHHFDYTNEEKIYCSELVYLCYRKATDKNPFLFKESDNVEVMRFDSFYQPDYFTVVWQAKN